MNFIKKAGGIPFNMIFGLRDFQLSESQTPLVAIPHLALVKSKLKNFHRHP